MSDHPCHGLGQTRITAPDGACAARFIKLCDDAGYYGGYANPHSPAATVFFHPHIRFTTGGLLAAIGRLVLELGDDGRLWMLEGQYPGGMYGSVPLIRTMNADDMASALGCTPDDVRQVFEALVFLNPKDQDT